MCLFIIKNVSSFATYRQPKQISSEQTEFPVPYDLPPTAYAKEGKSYVITENHHNV